MKTKISLSLLVIGLFTSTFSQNTIELTFTADNNGQRWLPAVYRHLNAFCQLP